VADKTNKNEKSVGDGTYREGEKFRQGLGGVTCRKETTWMTWPHMGV